MTLAQLLVVQEHDSAVDRLDHSRTTLPELTAIAALDDEQAHLEGERAALAARREAVAAEQQRLEEDAAVVTARIDRENERLYDGSVTAHKDLQAIQDELVTLNQRRTEIEDHVIEAMEAGEPLDAAMAELDNKLAAVDERRVEATASLVEATALIDQSIQEEQAQREQIVASVAPELVAEYEASRAACGGIGICRLIDKTCQGCHLTLPAVDYDRIRKQPEDAIVRCSECNRILVR